MRNQNNNSRPQNTKNMPTAAQGNRPRPEIRDNLDQRKNLEQDFKGDDVTHNRKQDRKQSPKKKK